MHIKSCSSVKLKGGIRDYRESGREVLMGLFRPKINATQLQFVATTMRQVEESVNLVNSTIKPDVFFGRLHFTLDLLLSLQPYEKYGIFTGGTPTKDYNKITGNLENIVDSFIDRALETNNKKIAALKTEKARKRNREEFAVKLLSAFDCAHTFWCGNIGQTKAFPHYTGPLFTQNNYRRVRSIYDKLDEN